MTPYPLINGHRFDWSAVTVTLNGVRWTGFKSITYRQSLTPGVVRGTRAQVTGRTRGQYECEGSAEIYKEDYQDLLTLLDPSGLEGYMEKSFPVIVQYGNNLFPVLTDLLAGVRITSDEDAPSESGDALVVSVDLSIMRIERAGKNALSADQLLR